MAKHLTKQDIKSIINLIIGWSDNKLTWDTICSASEKIIHKKPTRQSLSTNIEIKSAYNSRKKAIRETGVINPKPSNLNIAAQRIAHLQVENDLLKKRNAALLEQFVIWQYNAYKHGLSEQQLNVPLPIIDRERTE